MSLRLCDHISDSFFIDVFWGEELLCTVYKKLFLRELKLLSRISSLEEFKRAFAELEVKLAKRSMVNLLARRGHLTQELCDKLAKKGFSQGAIDAALKVVKEGGFVDDREEMRRLARSELRKGHGARAVLFKLKQKHVSPEELSELKSEMGTQEKEALLNFLKKKNIVLETLGYAEKQKVYAQLARRGFSMDVISSVLYEEWN